MTASLLPAQVTLLREYVQGVNEMMFVLPSGAFDPQRHSGGLAAAQAELSEEVGCVNETFSHLTDMNAADSADQVQHSNVAGHMDALVQLTIRSSAAGSSMVPKRQSTGCGPEAVKARHCG
jgi:hypothetical protein